LDGLDWIGFDFQQDSRIRDRKLGGVSPFRLCFEKGVCLLVSCLNSQQQQSKVDWIGLDF
jgi:hypothetical protein